MEVLTYTKIDDFMTPTKGQWKNVLDKLQGKEFTEDQVLEIGNRIYESTGVGVVVLNPTQLRYRPGDEVKLLELTNDGWEAHEMESATWYPATFNSDDKKIVDEFYKYLQKTKF